MVATGNVVYMNTTTKCPACARLASVGAPMKCNPCRAKATQGVTDPVARNFARLQPYMQPTGR